MSDQTRHELERISCRQSQRNGNDANLESVDSR